MAADYAAASTLYGLWSTWAKPEQCKMNKFHTGLERALATLGLSPERGPSKPSEWQDLLHEMQKSFVELESEKVSLEQSLRSSSQEMTELCAFLTEASESNLAKERDKLSTVIAALGEGLCILDTAGRITYANPEAGRLFSLPHENLLGRTFSSLIPDCALPEDLSTLSLLGTAHDTQVSKDNGKTAELVYVVTPIHHVGKEFVGAVIVLRDITEEREAKRAIVLARDEALLSAKAKADFLAVMSHEIRTPLNGIVSLAELLLLTELDKEQKEDINTLQACAYSLRSIINNVLDFSKIEAGKLYIDNRKFKMKRSIEHLMTRLAVQMEEKHQEYSLYIDPDIPDTLVGDSLRIEQILTNLVGNAIKFTGIDGAIMVYVNLREETADELEILFSVCDSGIGIPQDKLAEIFDAFTQADNSTTRKHGGTGLGLSICSRLIEMMGGTMWVRSNEKIGSTFNFTLRFPKEGAEATSGEELSSEVQRRERLSRHLNILLAEDNEINQNTISRLLEAKGHTVEVANNGKQALTALENGPFDIVLMDLHMPVMDGVEATKIIRSCDSTYAQIPIVAFTAHAVEGVRETCIDSGMNEYLSKPIDYDELFSVIRDVTS